MSRRIGRAQRPATAAKAPASAPAAELTGGAPPLLWSLAPALAFLALMLTMIPDASGDKDGSEFTLVLATGGAAHPTGYPLYTMLGHAFVLAAHGLGASWPWAANAWSAVGGAVAIFFLHALAARLVPPASAMSHGWRFATALLPTALFGLNPIWTYEATLAEVYSWHLAWVCGAALLFVTLARELEDEGRPVRPARMAALWGFVCGVGGAHHTTAILVAGPLSLALLAMAWKRRAVGWREAGLVVGCAALPLASYAYVAWRAFHPAAWGWPMLEPSWSAAAAHVAGSQYSGFLGRFEPSPEQRVLLGRYVYPFLALGWGGLLTAWLATRNAALHPLHLGYLAATALGTAFAFGYGVPDPSSYFLAPLAFTLSVLPAALAALHARAGAARRWASASALALAAAALFLAPGWVAVGSDRRQLFLSFDRQVTAMWRDIPYARAIVLWPNDMWTRLREYQLLRGENPGLEVWTPATLTHPYPRRLFKERHGLDPTIGFDWELGIGTPTKDQRQVESMARAINQRTPLPVILFDAKHDSVRLLRK